MSTELSLEIIKTFNLKTILVVDTSEYCHDQELDNYLLEILPVNSSKWITVKVSKKFTTIFNSSSLGYKKVGDMKELIDLQDGIYEFKMSYKPNSTTVVQYYHLRTSALSLKYVDLLSRHLESKCDKDNKTYTEESRYLTRVKQYIDAAEYMVSEKHDKVSGINFYNMAAEMLKNIDNVCGKC